MWERGLRFLGKVELAESDAAHEGGPLRRGEGEDGAVRCLGVADLDPAPTASDLHAVARLRSGTLAPPAPLGTRHCHGLPPLPPPTPVLSSRHRTGPMIAGATASVGSGQMRAPRPDRAARGVLAHTQERTRWRPLLSVAPPGRKERRSRGSFSRVPALLPSCCAAWCSRRGDVRSRAPGSRRVRSGGRQFVPGRGRPGGSRR